MEMKNVKTISIPESIVANTSQTFSSTTNTNNTLTYFNYYPTSTSALGTCVSLRIKGKCFINGTFSWVGLWYNSDAAGTSSQVVLNTGSGWVETPFDVTCFLCKDNYVSGKWNALHFGGNITGTGQRWIRVLVSKVNNTNLDLYTDSNTAGEMLRLEIDSVEVGVSKITNSNGDIIWGSQDAFPYRQLECLNMYSTYIDLGFRPSASFYYAQCKFPSTWDSYGTWGMVYGAEGWTSNTANRFWFAMQSTSNGRLFQRIKNQGDTPVALLSALNQDTIYEARMRNYFAPSNTSGRYWIALQDTTNNSQVYGQYYNAASLSMNFNDFNNIGINIATRRNASGNFYANSGYLSFSLYSFYIRADGGDSASVVFNGIPVQRKSDGVCGLYDIYGSTFYPCMGSASSTCAGPVVSEYFEPSQLI